MQNVSDAIDDIKKNGTSKKFCELKAGNALEIGSMYECDPGDGVKRNFYVLEVRKDSVDLLMEKNITQGTSQTTMTWKNAMKYIDNNNLKTTWKNVINIDLPGAQVIANITGHSDWDYLEKNVYEPLTFASPNFIWLYDYTRECSDCNNNLGNTEAYAY